MAATHTCFRRTTLLAVTLGPLIVLLVTSHAVWGSGEATYTFWKYWSRAHPLVTRAANVITDWGNPLAYLVYGVIALQAVCRKRRGDLRLVLCYTAVQLCIALVLTHVLKNAFGMPRPFAKESVPQPWAFQSIYQSFPSGHTTEIVGAVLPLALWRGRLRDAVAGCVWVTLVAYSRVYLGRHYLMDIWGGMTLGCLSAFLIFHFARKRV
jgi:Membrane-associated phospholipid phosphatase